LRDAITGVMHTLDGAELQLSKVLIQAPVAALAA